VIKAAAAEGGDGAPLTPAVMNAPPTSVVQAKVAAGATARDPVTPPAPASSAPMSAAAGSAPESPPMTSAAAGAAAPSGERSRPDPSQLPTVKGECPAFRDGMISVAGTSLQLWAGTKPGPVYFYWHATTQHWDEVERALPNATKDVATQGGFVASFEETNMQGINTGNYVWYTGDFDAMDQLLACGIEKGIVDTTRIYTAGYSAGGIQACAMVTTHASYLAAAICYSGSAAVVGGTPKDPTRLPPVLVPHGAPGSDVLILDMAQQSVAWERDYTKAGGFAIDCMDGGDHLSSAFTRMGLDGHAMEFLHAHPYGVAPEPYAAALPSGWPAYCQIAKP
jgi:hypothetical protein